MCPAPEELPPPASLLIPPAKAAARLADRFAQALAVRQSDLSIRYETPEDYPFICELYASTRAGELARVNWPEPAKADFLNQQSAAQIRHYRRHFPAAAYLLVERAASSIGRIYLDKKPAELRVMDIALILQERGHGWGRTLMTAVLDLAEEDQAAVSLHVEPDNPARAWYQRLGFIDQGPEGLYRFMRLECALRKS
jgi:ribosomal protein S18 acetylase RimI-like enzyme